MPKNLNAPNLPPSRSNLHDDDSLTPHQSWRSRNLSRSPHPYHRRGISLEASTEAGEIESADLGSLPQTPPQSSSENDYATYDGNEATRWKQSTSAEDSGSEADDESLPIVRRLPAPPVKPRKGLRDTQGPNSDSTPSPLLTPAYLEIDARRLSIASLEAITYSKLEHERELRIERTSLIEERRKKKRHAEFVRRGTEVGLLGAIGIAILYSENVQEAAGEWYQGELLVHFGTVLLLYALYPLRLLYNSLNGSARVRICIPSTFDPAPLLYPIFLPVLVTLSLLPTFHHSILPNLILSISAIPQGVFSYLAGIDGYDTVHWLLASLPLLMPRTKWTLHTTRAGKAFSQQRSYLPLDREILIILYPLHQSLVAVLQYLTTTSLLPAEVHLLSISLINVLIHASAPQTVILKALIWGGGVCIFVLCGQVIQWGVTLARIPRSRFRRAGQLIRAQNVFLGFLNMSLQKKAGKFGLFRDHEQDSEADHDLSQKNTIGLKRRFSHTTERTNPGTRNELPSIGRTEQGPEITLNGSSSGSKPVRSRRRNTLPIPLPSNSRNETGRGSKSRRKRSTPSTVQFYLSMTPLQATVRKWTYAAYVYTVVLCIVLIGIRPYVETYALNQREPFGWAIGYLFGNIPSLRLWLTSQELDGWICLPSYTFGAKCQYRRLAQIRMSTFGEANTRLLICAYCLGVLITGMAVVLRLSTIVEVDTRRKVFHGMMVAMFLPCTFIDPTFASLALVLILAIFLLLDLFRASQLPPLSKPLAYFLQPYVDGRDLRGPVIVSHIFLLIGCAIPLWLSLAALPRTGSGCWKDWDVGSRDIGMVAGVICVGMGDAAASLIGRRFGRHKWLWSGGKSLEGSFAFAAAVTLGLVIARIWGVAGGWMESWGAGMSKIFLAASGASLMEAVLTGGNDNVIVPVVLWLLVRGLGI